MGKDTLRITCAEKEERYQRLLGPFKKYAGDKYKLSIKKRILPSMGWNKYITNAMYLQTNYKQI